MKKLLILFFLLCAGLTVCSERQSTAKEFGTSLAKLKLAGIYDEDGRPYSGVSILDLLNLNLIPPISRGILKLNGKHIDNLEGLESVVPADLKFLILHNNRLSEFPRKYLEILPEGLEHLDLSHNKITDIDFSALPKGLLRLNLIDNRLTHASLFGMPKKLEMIMLTYNQITHLTGLSALPPTIQLARFYGNKLPAGRNKQVETHLKKSIEQFERE